MQFAETWRFDVLRRKPWGAGPGVTPDPRRELIHGGSVATFLSLTVPGAIPRPIAEYPRAGAHS